MSKLNKLKEKFQKQLAAFKADSNSQGSSNNLATVFFKELSDQLSSTRFLSFFLNHSYRYRFILLCCLNIRVLTDDAVASFVLIRLFTTSGSSLRPLPGFFPYWGH